MSTEDPRVTAFGGGGYGFAGLIGTNVPKGEIIPTINEAESLTETDSTNSNLHKRSLATLVDAGDPISEQKGSFDVPPNSSGIFGGVGNWQAGEVANTSLWIKDPNGNYVDSATSINDPNQVIILPEQSSVEHAVLGFSILNPMEGEWTCGINFDNDANSYLQYAATTMAVGGMENMIQQYTQMFEATHPQNQSLVGDSSLVAKSSSSGWKCTCCKIAAYGLALIITSVGVGALATLTTASAIVVAVSNLAAWITLPMALGFITGLATGGILVVDFVLHELCQWLNACD